MLKLTYSRSVQLGAHLLGRAKFSTKSRSRSSTIIDILDKVGLSKQDWCTKDLGYIKVSEPMMLPGYDCCSRNNSPICPPKNECPVCPPQKPKCPADCPKPKQKKHPPVQDNCDPNCPYMPPPCPKPCPPPCPSDR